MDYDKVTHAALAIGVSSGTIHRWIKRGWLNWPEDTAITLATLEEAKAAVAKMRADQYTRIGKQARKYLTTQEVQAGKYAALQRYRERNKQTINRDDAAHKALHRHPYFQAMKAEMLAFYGTKCLACRKRPSNCMDHVRSLPMGPNTPANLQPLCRSCNSTKRDQEIDYRPDKGRWLSLRWGGWKVNGNRPGQRRTATGPKTRRQYVWDANRRLMVRSDGEERELGSSRYEQWKSMYDVAIMSYREAYKDLGAMLSPVEYKSFIKQRPPRDISAIMDTLERKALVAQNGADNLCCE